MSESQDTPWHGNWHISVPSCFALQAQRLVINFRYNSMDPYDHEFYYKQALTDKGQIIYCWQGVKYERGWNHLPHYLWLRNPRFIQYDPVGGQRREAF